MYMHINLVCCCLERCCDHIAFRETSWHLSDSIVTRLCEQCVCFCDGELPCLRLSPPECSVWCLADVPSSGCVEQRKEKKLAISKFLPWYQVVSCYCAVVKQGRSNPAEVWETENREIVEQGLKFRLPTAPGISRILRGVIWTVRQEIWLILWGYPGGWGNFPDS